MSYAYELCYTESNEQENSRSFYERPASRSSDEDKSLAHNTDLQVQSRHHFMFTSSQVFHVESSLLDNKEPKTELCLCHDGILLKRVHVLFICYIYIPGRSQLCMQPRRKRR